MALNNMGLGIIISARDHISEVTEHIHKGLEGLARAGEETSKSLTSSMAIGGKALATASVAIAAALGAVAFEFSEHAEKFSEAITQAGVASHATASELRGLEELARGKSLDSLRGSAIGMAEALRDLAKEGFNARESGEALDGTLALMKISMGALGSADAAAIAHDSLAQFGLRADQAGMLTDRLAVAMSRFGFQASELRGTMSGLAAGAQLTGASLDDTLIAVGLLHNVFPSATKAAAAMNAAMVQLSSSHGQKELRGIGVAVADATGKIHPLISILDQLATKTANMTDAQLAQKLETIAGGRAAGGLMAIVDGLRRGVQGANGEILKGSAAIAFLRDQMVNSTGTAHKMSEMLGDTMGGAITALKNAISNAGVAIGGSFEAPFKELFQGANLFVRGLTQLFTQGGFTGEVREAIDKHPMIKGFTEKVFEVVKRVEHLFDELGGSFTKAFAPFRPVIDQLFSAFSQLGHALGLTSQSADDNVSTWDAFGAIGGSVGDLLGNIAGTVLPILTTAVEEVSAAVVVLSAAWQDIKPAALGVFQVLSGVFGMIGGLLTGNWKEMWDGFVDTVVGAAKLVVNIVFDALKLIARMVDGIGAAFGKDLGVHQFLDRMQTEVNDRVSSGTSVLKSVVTGSDSASSPVSAQAALTARTGSTPIIVHAPPPGPQDLHVTVHSVLDGEKVGEGIAKAKRSSDGRSFHAVAAHGGAF